MKNILDKSEEVITKIAKVFDRIAGFTVFAAMLVVVFNVIFRKLQNISALIPVFERIGISKLLIVSYDYVGFLTALIVAFGIAYCLVNDAHISIDFIADKMNKKTHGVVAVITNIMSFIIMGIFTYSLFDYATNLLNKHSVSPNAQVPISIFVYIIAACFLLLDIVLLIKIRHKVVEVSTNES